uniref:MyoD family inhibitor n=1 Tax=Oncorhynchus mykiss TaxID=8022 RepID=A0A8C7PND9_ONCMY
MFLFYFFVPVLRSAPGSIHPHPPCPTLPNTANQPATRRSQASHTRTQLHARPSHQRICIPNQLNCCVHCILACLFCEFLTLCNIVLDCATCGSCAGDNSACFCCCCASEECGDCELPCDMDCGIIDACCESADCLEICMECCGLCFSS